MKNVIEIENLTKKYKNFTLGPINLNIPSGQIIGLIGENGAGKTTLIKEILNIIHPTTGSVKIFNKNNNENETEIKENIGVVLDNMFFPEILHTKDINSIMKSIYKTWDETLFFNYLEKFKIPTNSVINSLSKGMRKKLEIITALSHHPKLLILDEPTSGLDPVVRNEVLDIFLDFLSDDEHTILISSHITSDLEHISDQIIFIHNGNILLNESKDEIIDNYGILKCNIDDINKIDKQDKIAKRKTKYSYEILIKDKNKITKKYKDFLIDKITLEELMLIIIKGEN